MIFVFMFVFDVVGLIVSSACGMVIWNWFMPGFFGLPQLNLVYSIGIGLTIASFIPGRKHKSDELETDEGWKDMIHSKLVNEFCNPIMFVIFGWVIHQFV